jgi:RNA polymerase sigma-70 factor (ECF subfamily)
LYDRRAKIMDKIALLEKIGDGRALRGAVAMARGQLTDVLRSLRRVARVADGADVADGELLESYVARRDQAAFESLLLRHGPMVLGVCRRVLRNDADAHDAFQATFLVFVRKAHAIMPRGQVGHWLYGVAQKTALKARHLNRQRLAKERQASVPSHGAPDDASHELLARLDEAVSRLPAKYRTAVVLCHLEQASLQEAARRLGCPLGTVASRLARARALLARRLARCGLSVGVGAIAAALAEGAAPPVLPSTLVSATVQAAATTSGQAVAAGFISAQAAALADSVLHVLLIAQCKSALAILGAGLLVGGALLAASLWSAGDAVAVRPSRPVNAVVVRNEPVSDREALQGTWIAVSAEFQGRKLGEAELKPWGELIFTADRVTRGGLERRTGPYALHADRTPRQIELFTDANPWKGTYELADGKLRLAIQIAEAPARRSDSRDAIILTLEKRPATQTLRDKTDVAREKKS